MSASDNLIAAACCGDVALVRRILQADPTQVHARDPHIGTTPLHCAAHRGFLEIVQALLDAGADIMSRESCCDTIPLHVAAWRGHADVARTLVDHGANLHSKDDRFESTPFIWAKWHHQEAVAALLKQAEKT